MQPIYGIMCGVINNPRKGQGKMNTKKQKKTTPAKGKTNSTSAKAAIPAKATSKAAKPTADKAKPAAAKPTDKVTAPKAAAAKPGTAKNETPKATPAKAEPAKAVGDAKPKLSLVKAAIAVLEASEEALNTKQMVEAAKAKGLWTPGAGKTPEQTLYSAIIREIKSKGENARFTLVAKGHFKLNASR